MIRLVLWLIITLLTAGCALSGQYATHVLRDGSHLQTFWFDDKNPEALNSNMTVAFHCKKLVESAQENCSAVAQGYGTGEGILLKFFQGGATAASIGAVGAIGGFQDDITLSASPSANAASKASAISKSDAISINTPAVNKPHRPVHKDRY